MIENLTPPEQVLSCMHNHWQYLNIAGLFPHCFRLSLRRKVGRYFKIFALPLHVHFKMWPKPDTFFYMQSELDRLSCQFAWTFARPSYMSEHLFVVILHMVSFILCPYLYIQDVFSKVLARGFRIRSNIVRIRIQTLSTDRIHGTVFFPGSGSIQLCIENFIFILRLFLIRNCWLFHFLMVPGHNF